MIHDVRDTRLSIVKQAWPIIVANISVPLLGLVDTAVLGHAANVNHLAALALCNLIFNFVYWAFGFFRMSTTAFVAQALGKDEEDEALSVFIRASVMAFALGVILLLLQNLLSNSAFFLLQAPTDVEILAREYYDIRIWGAPATLALYCIMGLCIGYGRTRLLLLIQVIMNLANIVMDILFSAILDYGIKGIAYGTVLAEWGTVVLGLSLLKSVVFKKNITALFSSLNPIFERNRILQLLRVNNDIFIRTLFLLAGFAVFTNVSAQYGSNALASNHILLMFISFSAFFLDGFAFVAEQKVAENFAKRNWIQTRKIIHYTTQLAIIATLFLAATIFLIGYFALYLFSDIPTVINQTKSLLPYAICYIVLSVGAFQMDGIFIGATLSAQMRNASILSFSTFIVSWFIFGKSYGIEGLWSCFILFVIARAFFLLCYWRKLRGCFKTS